MVFDRHRFKTIDFDTLRLKIPPDEQDGLHGGYDVDVMNVYESYDVTKYRTLETYLGAAIELPTWKWCREDSIKVTAFFLYSRPEVRGFYNDPDLSRWRLRNDQGYWLNEKRLFERVHSVLLSREQLEGGSNSVEVEMNLRHGYLNEYRALPLNEHLCERK